MNCEKCHELLSDFLDGTLPPDARAQLERHLGACLSCASAREELSAIVATARESREHLVAPPDERAMWLRIRDEIEADARERARRSRGRAAASQGLWGRADDRVLEAARRAAARALGPAGERDVRPQHGRD
ncbi:MAG: zf-HC2 domain-containing protein [Acidobacteria bacterium]|nr:zf-HC2 domain-containing protein [Acidobacteriota bacterium]